MQPASPDSYKLLHHGALALARAECHGIRMDMEAVHNNRKAVAAEIAETERWMRDQPEYHLQRKLFGSDTNVMSRDQLAQVLFGSMGLPYDGKLGARGQYLLPEERLAEVGTEYTNKFVEKTKLDTLLNTFLEGICREVTEFGRIHAFYNLHKVITYRSSADSPNMQNMPIRDPKQSRYIRTCFIPEEGQVLLEIDFSQAEVRVATCYHRDPTMLEYLATDYDIHRAMAGELFCYPTDKVPKAVRQLTKGDFVFAEYYGDYWAQVAKKLWKGAWEHDVTAAKAAVEKRAKDPTYNTPPDNVVGNLQAHGIKDYQGFAQHVKRIEADFWGKRFPVYNAWRTKWWQAYVQWGYFYTLTGFRIHGNFKRNEVINSPVQGSAFHCLLRSFIELDRRILLNGMGARLLGQIHDSILVSVPLAEVAQFTTMANEVMGQWLAKQWPWLIVPMLIEVEASHVNWHQKRKLGIGQEYNVAV